MAKPVDGGIRQDSRRDSTRGKGLSIAAFCLAAAGMVKLAGMPQNLFFPLAVLGLPPGIAALMRQPAPRWRILAIAALVLVALAFIQFLSFVMLV